MPTVVANVFYDYFISYSRADSPYATKLRDELRQNGSSVWLDTSSMTVLSPDWLEEVRDAIRRSDVFVVLLTPRYVESPHCQTEVQIAISNGKRLAIIEHREIAKDVRKTLHAELQRPSWLPATEATVAATRLAEFAKTDLHLVRLHTKTLQQATFWIGSGRPSSLQLRGKELRMALSWWSRAKAIDNLGLTVEQVEFLTASARSAELKRTAFFHAAIVAALALALWSIERTDFWQAGRAYLNGSSIAAQAHGAGVIEWGEALVQLGKLKEAANVASIEGAPALASSLLAHGHSQQALEVLDGALNTFTLDGPAWQFDGMDFDLKKIPSSSQQATAPDPLAWLIDPHQTKTPLSATQLQLRANRLESSRVSTPDRIADFVNAAFRYAADKSTEQANEMLQRAISETTAEAGPLRQLLILDKVAGAARRLRLADAEDQAALAMFWALRRPPPIFAHRVWLEAAQSGLPIEGRVRRVITHVHKLPAISRALGLLSLAEALHHSVRSDVGMEMEAALQARNEISSDFLRTHVTAATAGLLGRMGRQSEAQQILREERTRLDSVTPTLAPQVRTLCLFELAAALQSAGSAADAENTLLQATADGLHQLRVAGKISPLVIGGWMNAASTERGIAPALLAADIGQRLEEPMRSRVYGLLAEAILARRSQSGFKPLAPSELTTALIRVGSTETRRDLLLDLFPTALKGNYDPTSLATVWDCLSQAMVAGETTLRDADAARKLASCDVQKLQPVERSLARALAAKALARAHRIREAQSAAESFSDPDDRLIADAAIVSEYATSDLGRQLSRLWPNWFVSYALSGTWHFVGLIFLALSLLSAIGYAVAAPVRLLRKLFDRTHDRGVTDAVHA